ncbi:MAG: hypothetical protein H6739_40755 [Alphaproteobacteria bacterium]|nr:hypothetical protein [Alphaproteobacteria bacterium]
MTRFLLPAALLLPGCALTGTPNLEGSWLFQADRNGTFDGDCVDPDDDSTTTYIGTSDSIIEIYKAADGSYVVGADAMLIGDWNDDKVFVAEWVDSYEESGDDWSVTDSVTYWLRGSWDGVGLVGTMGNIEDQAQTTGNTTTSWHCDSRWDYTAVEITSSENKYVED